MTPVFWCIKCGATEYNVVTASQHQLPPTNHHDIRQIGTLP